MSSSVSPASWLRIGRFDRPSDIHAKLGSEVAEAWRPRNPAIGWESVVPPVQRPRRCCRINHLFVSGLGLAKRWGVEKWLKFQQSYLDS